MIGTAQRFQISTLCASYRYHFNGQEKDDEVYGKGNMTTAEYWQYDTRLGRRWNADPVVKVWESCYATFANNPICYVDLLGADTLKTNGGNQSTPSTLPTGSKLTGSSSLLIFIVDDPTFNAQGAIDQSGSWDVIVAPTLEDAQKVMQAHYQEGSFNTEPEINNLVIRTHGSGGDMVTQSGSITDPNGVTDPNDPTYKDVEALKYFRGLLSDDATVFSTACNQCFGPTAANSFATFWIDGKQGRHYLANMGLTNSTKDAPNSKPGDPNSTYFPYNQWLLGSSWAGMQWYYLDPLKNNTMSIVPRFYDVKLNTSSGQIDKKETEIPFFHILKQ
jgi:hypothetical protein